MKSFAVQFMTCLAIVGALFACLPAEVEAGGGLAFVAPQRTVRRFTFNPLTLTVRQSVRQDAPAAIVQRQVFAPLIQRQVIVPQQLYVPQAFVAPQAIVVPQCQPQALIVPGGSAAFFLR